jgi:hypothetical protein
LQLIGVTSPCSIVLHRYRDLYYEEIAYDHNTRTGHGLGAKTDEYNKKRAKVNDLVVSSSTQP